MKDKEEKKQSEILFLNSLLRSIRIVNQLLIKDNTPIEIINGVCKILLELEGFSTVWVNIKDHLGNDEIYAEAGIGPKFSDLKKFLKKKREINCTSGLEKGKSKIIKSPKKECGSCPMVNIYLDRSAISTLISYGERDFGTITVSFDKSFHHLEEIGDLLIEVSGDLGFKLNDIEIEEIKKRKKRESEEFLRSVFDSVQDGISVLDKDLNITMVNHKMEEWYKINMPLVGKKCFNCYHDAKEPCVPCPSKRALISGKTEMDVVPGLPGSDTKWLELYSFPLRGPGREIIGVVEFVRDITEKVYLRNRIQESEHRYRMLFENSSIGIGISDRDGNILDANEKMCEIIGYSKEELKKVDLRKTYVNPKDRDKLLKKLKIDGFVSLQEVKLKRRGGEEYWASLTINRVKIEEKELFLTACVDISRRKKAEHELIEHREHLEDLVNQRTAEIEKINKELSESNSDLERFFEASVDREFRIKELKDQVEDLKKKLKFKGVES